MKQTIEELWNGNLASAGKCGVQNPGIKELIGLMQRHNARKALDGQQYVLFEKYVDCYDEYMYRMTAHAFCDGFGLAGKLLAESLSMVE